MIYAIVNTKGGVGKTTTAVHLATMLASRKEGTLLIDGDPQTSAASWAAWRRQQYDYGPLTVVLAGRAIFDEGRDLSAGFNNTVVDAGGRDSVGLRSALLLAQRAIVPIGASNLDAAAMTDLLEIVELAKDFNPMLDVRVLLTRIDPRTRDAKEMIEYLKTEGLNILEARICERVAFRRSIGAGAIVQEITKNRDVIAIAEMEAFFDEVTA